MAWARLDDHFAFNTKVVQAGNEVAGIFARAICWSSANNTDGYIPASIASILASKRRAIDALSTLNLVSNAGLWVAVEAGDEFLITGRKDSGRRPLPDVHIVIKADGYYIRDYLHYNRASTDARAGESADARANVQQVRSQNPSLDARAARPVPYLEPLTTQPTVVQHDADETNGLVGTENGEVELDYDTILKDIPF